MSKNKTTETDANVADYLQTIADEKKRSDCFEIITLMTTITGYPPKMWGSQIVGFGHYHYSYESGREGDAPLVGLSSRTKAIALYLTADFGHKEALLQRLGKHKTGKGCLYLQKLDDVDVQVLSSLIRESVDSLKSRYPS